MSRLPSSIVDGVPDAECLRSPATRRTAELARRSGLFAFHFEHRVRLPLPETWLPPGRPDLGDVPGWRAGVLPEPKYAAFRHDLLPASFHPGHRAKWTGHELCHGLVGFAWRPDATLLFHALAARTAEVLPVALWYFLDEAGLRRCPDHEGQGPLWGAFCRACEEAAALGPRDDPHAERWRTRGRAFVHRELTAVLRSKKEGRPVPSRHGTLDLSSDGLAYAAAHGPRLSSAAFRRWAETFFRGPEDGLHPTLDSLEARVLEVLADLTGDAEAKPLGTTPERLAAQDLALRLLQVREDTEGEAASALESLFERLAAGASPSEIAAGYAALHDDYELPDPDDVFAVGYDLPGTPLGRSVRQVADGLASACPRTAALLGGDRDEIASALVRDDARRPERLPIGRRLARLLAEIRPGAAADLARYEAALAHAAPPDPAAVTLGASDPAAGALVPAPGLEVLALDHDVHDVTSDPPRPIAPSVHLALRRAPDGDVDVFELGADAAADLAAGRAPSDPRAVGNLLDAGLLVPRSWRLHRFPPG